MLGKIKDFLYRNRFKIAIGAGIAAVGCLLYDFMVDESEVKLSAFIKAVKKEQIDEVIVEGQNVFFKSGNSSWFRTFIGSFPVEEIYSLIKDKNIVYSTRDSPITKELTGVIGSSIFALVAFKMLISDVNKGDVESRDLSAGVIKGDNKFDDVYGGELIKHKFREIIDFLKFPKKYERFGARIRRGVLFYGPPGTGKTMLARALANESGCEFIKVAASQFQQIFVGVGPKRVRQLFKNARACPNGCIIFVDEIDALGSRMNHLRDSHETTSTITQFLSEMDGFSPTDRIVIVAATNRIDLVDSAILRAGRFDIKVHIPLPSYQQKKGIFKKIIQKKIRQSEIADETITSICQKAENWSGADIETLINESIYKAIRKNKQVVGSQEVEIAFRQFVKSK